MGTINKETIDAKDDDDKRIWWKEIALEHGYDHDLSTFARTFKLAGISSKISPLYL